MNHRLRSSFALYSFAAGAAVLTAWLRLLLAPYLDVHAPFGIFFFAVAATAIYGGFGPTLAATIISALAALYFFVPPPDSLFPETSISWASLLIFLTFGAAAALLSEWLTRQSRRIHQERERFFVTLSSIGDGVIVTDTESKVTFLNTIAEELTGWRLADARGVPLETVFNIINEDSRLPTENPVNRAIESDSIVGLANHTVLIAKDGTERAIEDSAAPIRDPGGAILGVVLVFRDVSEQRLLERGRARLAALVDSSEDAILAMTFEGVVTDWNIGAEQLFGFTADEAVGKPIFSTIVPPDKKEELMQVLERVSQEKQLDPFETVRACRNATRIPVAIRISPIRSADGSVVGASAIVRDITERKEAERALKESEERFRALADNIAQLAWMTDHTGWVFWYNQRWFDYTGGTLEEMEGWGWASVQHPDYAELVSAKFKQHIQSGIPWEDTFPLRGKTGEYRWFLSRAFPIRDSSGRITYWFGTNTDVTEQRAIQEKLQHLASKLAAADRRKDEFLATLAHELRNPLAPIRSGLELLKSAKDNPEMVEEVRHTLVRQTAQLTALVDDLLDVSRITRGKLNLKKRDVPLEESVLAAVEAVRPHIEEFDHTLSVSMPEESIYVNADEHRLAQIFSNLLANAAKFTPRCGRIELAVERQGENAVASIKDNGIGIPEEKLERIFDMFTQVELTALGGQTGLGIGLTLVQSLVKLHGGRIEVRSEGEYSGSEFIITLPARPAPAKAGTQHAAERNKSSQPRRVLLVDDNESAVKMLGLVLQGSGHIVQIAGNGREALEQAESFRPEVVLMDIGMPIMNGYEAAEHIRRQPWGKDMLLVAVTGWGQEEDRKRTNEAGFDYHLVKPADPDKIEALLAEPTSVISSSSRAQKLGSAK